MIKKILLAVVAISLGTSLFSQAGSFVNIPTDAKTIGMGSTYIALENTSSIFGNLASNALSDQRLGVSVNYRPWLNNISSDYNLSSMTAYVGLHPKSSFAFGFKKYSMPGYSITDNAGNTSGNYNPSESSWSVGYAYKVNLHSAVSLSLQFLQSDLGSGNTANTVLLDIGYKSKYKDLSYGIVAKNIGPEIKFPQTSTALPLTIGAGIYYSFHKINQHQLLAAVDVSYLAINDYNGTNAGVGLEYLYRNTLALRSGYNLINEELGISSFSLGAGVKIKGVYLDVSWLLGDHALKNNFSFSCAFGLYK